MKKVLFLFTTLLLLAQIAAKAHTPEVPDIRKGTRPKVAVVLSGGGAKGAAHIGALKVIEEAGIPVDMIVGTSMGAIIGGLYSVGHTPECLDSLLKSQDWPTLLTDRKKEQEQSFLSRERDDNFIISIPLGKNHESDTTQNVNSKAGIIEGRNILKMFQRLIPPEYGGNISFDKLPVRFACVAVDAASGKEIVFRSGQLDTAMRASMSIPGVFRPIRKDSMLLIDGGILNNYPVDVARKMGADIVIGVNVGEGLHNADRIKSMMDIANQIASIYETEKREKNIKDTDLYIKVNVKGFTMASFTNEAIDTLIMRGEEAARANFDKLKAMADTLGGNKQFLAGRGNHYEAKDSAHADNEYEFEAFPTDAIGFSANFNQEEMASLITQAHKTYQILGMPSQIGATIRLGKRYRFVPNLSVMLSKGLYVDFNYEVGYNDVRFNKEGSSFANTTFSDNIISASISKSWRWAKIDGGVRFNNYNYKSILIDREHTSDQFTDNMDGSRNFWNFFTSLGVNTTNKKQFATSGMRLKAEINIFKGHEIAINDKNTIYSANFSGTFHIPLSRRLCLIPALHIRTLNKRSYTYGISNIVGGEWESHYISTQIPFYGLSYIEWIDRTTAVARIQARYRMGKNHYLTGTFNAGDNGDGFEDLIKTRPMYGYGINYSYDSIVGPLGFTISGSNISTKPNLLVSLGYVF